MADPELIFHGAALTVTGSCFEIVHGGHHLLVDCGLFQGSRSLEALNHQPLPFAPSRIDAVLLSHAHIDHSGLLPRLAAEGFRGPIWCTAPTRDLLGVLLPDAARIQEQEAMRRNRRPDRADLAPIEPLYTEADAEAAVALVRSAALEQEFTPAPGFAARFWNAGHILGSTSVELAAGGTRLLFSGDLGPVHKSFHRDPAGPRGVDHLLCESTYGDRERDDATAEQRREQLRTVVEKALAKGGNLVIPAFALERTQELLLDLARLINQGRLRRPQLFVDSPLARRVTDVFRKYGHGLEDLGDGEVFDHPAFHFTDSVEQSIRLNQVSGAIILAASGMCEAGRIRHHLLHNLPRADSTILFVGFQAAGTLGRALLDGAGRVRISGRDVAVRAAIARIDHYSAHADRGELLAWMEARRPVRGSLFLTHGEPAALDALQRDAATIAGQVIVPEIGERYALPAGAKARRLATGRTELRAAIGRDWQNDYADFTANLKAELARIEGEAQRRKALAQMRRVLDSYRASRRAHRGGQD